MAKNDNLHIRIDPVIKDQLKKLAERENRTVSNYVESLIKKEWSKMREPVKGFESVGHWWNDNNIELVKVEGKVYALAGWNGEKYTECWVCTGKYHMDASTETYTLTPEYRETGDGDYEIINYRVDKN